MSVFLPSSERNLILTGYIGVETQQLGRQIAEQLRMPFVNLHAQIAERLGLSIDEIRTYYGETRLKAIEMEIIQEAALRRSTVIRVSGRTLLNADHLARLQTTGPVIGLVIGLNAMLQRLHMSMGARYHDPRERAFALGDLKREWAVRGKSGIHEVDATYMQYDEVMQAVIALWQELAIERV